MKTFPQNKKQKLSKTILSRENNNETKQTKLARLYEKYLNHVSAHISQPFENKTTQTISEKFARAIRP